MLLSWRDAVARWLTLPLLGRAKCSVEGRVFVALWDSINAFEVKYDLLQCALLEFILQLSDDDPASSGEFVTESPYFSTCIELWVFHCMA